MRNLKMAQIHEADIESVTIHEISRAGVQSETVSLNDLIEGKAQIQEVGIESVTIYGEPRLIGFGQITNLT